MIAYSVAAAIVLGTVGWFVFSPTNTYWSPASLILICFGPVLAGSVAAIVFGTPWSRARLCCWTRPPVPRRPLCRSMRSRSRTSSAASPGSAARVAPFLEGVAGAGRITPADRALAARSRAAPHRARGRNRQELAGCRRAGDRDGRQRSGAPRRPHEGVAARGACRDCSWRFSRARSWTESRCSSSFARSRTGSTAGRSQHRCRPARGPTAAPARRRTTSPSRPRSTISPGTTAGASY